MLSSVAQRLYWMARYLERIDNTSRLIHSFAIHQLDASTDRDYSNLLRTIDAEEDFSERHATMDEVSVIKYLVADRENPNSLRCIVQATRENVRTTRDQFPIECWTLLNDLNIHIATHSHKALTTRTRGDFFETIAAICSQLSWVIYDTMTRDQPFHFLRLGQMHERADMISRNVDTAILTASYWEIEQNLEEHEWVWNNLLFSLQAASAYRRNASPVVESSDVHQIIDFLFTHTLFPKSILYCLQTMRSDARAIGNGRPVVGAIDTLRKNLVATKKQTLNFDETHLFIDGFQEGLIGLYDQIAANWFAQ